MHQPDEIAIRRTERRESVSEFRMLVTRRGRGKRRELRAQTLGEELAP